MECAQDEGGHGGQLDAHVSRRWPDARMGRGRRDRAEEVEVRSVEAASREHLTYDWPEQARRRDSRSDGKVASVCLRRRRQDGRAKTRSRE